MSNSTLLRVSVELRSFGGQRILYRPQTNGQDGELEAKTVEDLIREILTKSKSHTKLEDNDFDVSEYELTLDGSIVLGPSDLCTGDHLLLTKKKVTHSQIVKKQEMPISTKQEEHEE